MFCYFVHIRTVTNLSQALTAIVLDESRRPNSKWAPYIAILPRKLDSLIFWSDGELSELQASKVINKIGKSGAEKMFSKFIVPLGLAGYNTEECHRMASVIMSYAFDIPESNAAEDERVGDEGDDLVSDDEDDEKTTLSMIPLADMLYVYLKDFTYFRMLQELLVPGSFSSLFHSW